MDNVVFSATTRNGKYYFEVEDDGGKVDRYTIRQDGSTNYVNTPNQILGELVMQTEWKEGTFEKILVDELGIGKEYLQIVKMIRAKYNWLEKLPKGSEGRIFYFNIGRYFRNGLYKNIPSDKIFKMIDDYIATSNFKEDVKSEKKVLKESAKSESIVAKLSKEFLGYNVSIVSKVDDVDSITVGIDSGFGENRDKNKSRDIYNYIAKELCGYADTKVTYDSAIETCIIDFYNVSFYSDRELIQTIEDIVWNVNAKFDIKDV